MNHFRTRLAPSPTGHLHLGHVLHLIRVERLAAQTGAQILFRVEDHDQSRCKPEFVASILEDMRWLGLDVPAETGKIWLQSKRQQRYQKVFENLMSRNLIYACRCSRKDIQSATGQASGELRYPGTCRDAGIPLNTPDCCLRLTLPDQDYHWRDLLAGDQEGNPQRQCGDMVIKDRDGNWTYQLCVVVDDLDQDIDLVVRGEDLLSSTPRQMALRSMIAPEAHPITFAHHPLLRDGDGEKLSKRLSSEGIRVLRERGLTPAEVRSLAEQSLLRTMPGI